MLHALSTLVLVLIAGGVMSRRHPERHVPLMTAAFVLDVVLVFYIEATRHAVEKAVGPAAPIVWIHALASTAVLGLYAAQIVMGRRLQAGRASSRRAHIVVGLSFVLLRGFSYVTSYMVVAPAAAAVEAHDARPTAAAWMSASQGGR